MRRPYGVRKSLKQTLTDNQRALDHMADSAGKPRLALYAPEPVKPRQRREPSGNAVPLERDVLKAVWKYLAHHPKVQWITRMNSGTAMADFGNAGMVPLRFNYKRGMSDLLGQLKDGRIICVECKREGVALQDHQREFLNEVRSAKGVSFVARSVDDCIKEMANV